MGDYGNPDDPNDFDFIYPISPIQNVPKGKVLPPCLLMTADRAFYIMPLSRELC
jgi:prolyl oligopeptidase